MVSAGVLACAILALTVIRFFHSGSSQQRSGPGGSQQSATMSAPDPRPRPEGHSPLPGPLLPPIQIEDVLQDAKKRSFAQRQDHLAREVSTETTSQKVRNLLYSTPWIGDPLLESEFGNADEYLASLRTDPRVASLMDLAIHGSDADKLELKAQLIQMCQVYLHELPLVRDSDSPWQPSVRCPGGGKAYPYLLAYVDRDATTLPLLVKMYLRMQSALKQYHKAKDDEWFSSKAGLVFAYACDSFLNACSSRADLRTSLTQRQLKILQKYADHRSARPKDWNLDLKQCAVMEYAVAVVEAGNKNPDGTPSP
jgi:hypothetical protein